jgi:predicted acylesterase/phospholipase RssA
MNKNSKPRIALALAGGGPLGASYELGALCALQDSVLGLDLTQLDHYVGVSAGGFWAAGLANGISAHDLAALYLREKNAPVAPGEDVFDLSWLTTPAYGELARRAIMLPGLMLQAAWTLGVQRKSLARTLEVLGRALPSGILDNRGIDEQLKAMFTKPGRTNDFRQLKTRLTLVATHLDSGEAAPFGEVGLDDVPISKAVQASAALPGLFPPVDIKDAYFVDGALKKTMHASVALESGCDLLICMNPLVPFDATVPELKRVMLRGLPPEKQRIPSIDEGGLPSVLSQTFRSMIHSRMELGMRNYAADFPNTAIMLLEPDHRDAELYLANTFSYSQRRHVAEHAYQSTRAMLRSNQTQMSAKLAKAGLSLNFESLHDTRHHLLTPQKAPTRIGRAVQNLQEVLDDISTLTPEGAAKPAWT